MRSCASIIVSSIDIDIHVSFIPILLLFFSSSSLPPDSQICVNAFAVPDVKDMTLDEKIGQMTLVDHRWIVNATLRGGDIEKYGIGCIFRFSISPTFAYILPEV